MKKNCWRIDIQRQIVPYLHGRLSAETNLKIEDHLTECDACRSQMSQISETSELLTHLPRFQSPDKTWSSIEAAIRADHKSPTIRNYPVRFGMKAAILIVVATALAFLLQYGLKMKAGDHEFEEAAFHEVPLAGFPNNDEPHVTTEGYVSELHVDQEDGDLRFKLVDNPNRPDHFVVCEIIAPLNLKAPSEGSRIRVYGVSRYDGKREHQWFEIHPVLNIEHLD